MIPSEAVANEIAAPAASEAAAPGTGQEYVSVGPTAPGDLPVATPTGSAAAGVQLGTLPSSKTLLSSKIPSRPVVTASRRGSPAVAGSRTKNLGRSLRGCIPESSPVMSRRGYISSRGIPR